ncbi:MAG: Arc family DNA-binding protein [Gammaproteobacteria bacterium]
MEIHYACNNPQNLPDNLYLQLKEAAQSHHRSLNSEILYCVERTLGTHKIDVSEHLKVARTFREKTAANPVTNDELTAAKNAGRA